MLKYSLSALVILVLTIGSVIAATIYPTATSPGAPEIAGGTFNQYFTNTYRSAGIFDGSPSYTNGCALGQVVRGFTTQGMLLCISPTSQQYWSSTDAGVNIYFTGAGNVGIGVTNATRKLEVSGDAVINGITVGRGGGNNAMNTINGASALRDNTTGLNNTANGYFALVANTTGNGNTANGSQTLISNTTGGNNTANGLFSLYFNTTGGSNTANGVSALQGNTTGNNNTANGASALSANITGYQNTAIGMMSQLSNTTGGDNVAIGNRALTFNTTGNNNTALGSFAGDTLTSGNNNIAIGYNVNLPSTTASNQLNIGNWIYGTSGNIGIGTGTSLTAKLTVAGQVQITGGTPGLGKVLTSDATGLATWATPSGWGLTGNAGTTAGTNFIGTTDNIDVVFKRNNIEAMRLSGASGNLVTTADATVNGMTVGRGSGNVSTNTANGLNALRLNTVGSLNTANGYSVLMSNTTGYQNTANGAQSLQSNTTGWSNTANGYTALLSNTTGNYNTANGVSALQNNTAGSQNIANGHAALFSNTIGNDNTANGFMALQSNTTGNSNTANGENSLYFNSTGSNNAAYGYNSLLNNTNGTNNTSIGSSAGSNITTGSSNIAIGANSTVLFATGSNQLSIGNWIYGTSGNIGIGTGTALTAKLTVAGQVQITGGTPGAGKVLTSDAVGLASWQAAASSGWGLTGNAGTTAGTNFLGTTDNIDVVFKRNNIERMRLSGASGNLVTTADAVINGVTVGRGRGNMYGNVVNGSNSLSYNTTGWENTANGEDALFLNTTGFQNTAIGSSTLYSNTTGFYNTAIGSYVLGANTTGNYNTANGIYSLPNNSTGNHNTANGSQSLFQNTTGNNNTALGDSAGYNLTSGDNNIAVGYNTNFPSTTASNQLNIGNWIYGTSGNIGIGTGTSLTAKLTVAGQVQITGGTPGLGKVLMSDANGLATWEAPSDMPIGAIVAFNAASCPVGWVAANGTSGTIDLRGEFIRGLDSGRGVDVGRALGTAQIDLFKSHVHNYHNTGNPADIDDTAYNNATEGIVGNTFFYNGNQTFTRRSPAVQPTGGTETRPRNVALLYCTKISSSTSTVSNNLTWSNVTGTSTGDVTLATTGNVGIGTTGPTAKLEVNGQIKITGGTPGVGKVLTSDAAGLASWATPSGGVTGGQTNYMARWLTASTLGTGSIFDNGTNVGIGTATPTAKLDVVGGDAVINGVTVGRGSGNVLENTTNGYQALYANTAGSFNTANGYRSLYSNIGGYNNTAIGQQALRDNTSGYWNAAIGAGALVANTVGYYNTANGVNAMFYNISGHNNTANGANALFSNTTGIYNTANGVQGLAFNTIGSYNTANGLMSLNSNINGNSNTALGYLAGSNLTSGDNNIAIGANTNFPSTTASNQLNIGNWIYGTSGNIGIGTGTVLTAKLTVAGTVQIVDGSQGSGKVLTSNAAGVASWISPSDMPIGAVVAFNTATCPTGWVAADGSGAIDLRGEFIRGLDSGRGVDASRVLGTAQVDLFKSHTHNLSLASGGNGTSISLMNAAGGGAWNSALTQSDGGTETRPRNVALLYCTKISSSTSTVSNNLTWSNVTGTSTGDVTLATTGNVGIGTTGPTAKLEVNGQIKVTGGTPGVGKVLTSDAAGLASWATPSAGAITGGQTNYGARWLTATTLGTGSVFDTGTGVGIGTLTPSAKLAVNAIGVIGFANNAAYDIGAGRIAAGQSIYSYGSICAGAASGDCTGGGGFLANSAGTVTANGTVTVGTTSSRLYMNDTDESSTGPKSLHANSNVIGFLSGGGGWLQYTNDAGQIWTPNYGWLHDGFRRFNVWQNSHYSGTDGAEYATIFYDANNSGYYADPSNISQFNRIDFDHMYDRNNYAYYIDLNNASVFNVIYAAQFLYNSDIRLKQNIIPIKNSLSKILSLNGYTFDWKKDGKHDIGVIAQEVEKVFPDIVHTDEKTGMKSVEYGNLVAPIIEAIKELAKNVKNNTTEIDALQSENAALKKRLDAIEARLAK